MAYAVALCLDADSGARARAAWEAVRQATGSTVLLDIGMEPHVTLAIYDAAGRRIVQLVDAVQEEGLHRITWDGRDSRGAQVASGIYFSRLVADGTTVTGKMVLAR